MLLLRMVGHTKITQVTNFPPEGRRLRCPASGSKNNASIYLPHRKALKRAADFYQKKQLIVILHTPSNLIRIHTLKRNYLCIVLSTTP
jgi:hypothetical protein